MLSSVVKASHNLTVVTNPGDTGVANDPGEIDGGEAAASVHKAVGPCGVAEVSHDLTAVVDAPSDGGAMRSWHIDRVKPPSEYTKPWLRIGVSANRPTIWPLLLIPLA